MIFPGEAIPVRHASETLESFGDRLLEGIKPHVKETGTWGEHLFPFNIDCTVEILAGPTGGCVLGTLFLLLLSWGGAKVDSIACARM